MNKKQPIISRPTLKNLSEIHVLFSQTLTNNFKQEGIFETHRNELEQEIESQVNTLKLDFQTKGKKEYFLIAKLNHQIVGTIAYGQANEIITKNLTLNYANIPEIKSVYVLPAFHHQGIGSLLLMKIIGALSQRKIAEFCLDCGYKTAQTFWQKKLGAPTCILKDYWANGSHHMIWHRTINEVV